MSFWRHGFQRCYVIIGYCWTERHAAGRQEASGAKSQCGIEERNSGKCPGAGQMTAGGGRIDALLESVKCIKIVWPLFSSNSWSYS